MDSVSSARGGDTASFSGRGQADGPKVRQAQFCWSKVRLPQDHMGLGFEEATGSQPHAFAFEAAERWDPGLKRARQHVHADTLGLNRKAHRRKGSGVRLVVDSNPAVQIPSPLLQNLELRWEKAGNFGPTIADPSLEAVARGDRLIVESATEQRSERVENVSCRGKRREGEPWHDVARRKAAEILRHVPRLSPEAENTCKHLFSGAMAAAVARTSVAPLERVKIEYIIHNVQTTVPKTVSRILNQEGPGGFWKGNGVNILRTAPFKAVNFYAFDFYRKAFLSETGQRDLTNWERIVAGAAAGATATVVCFPLDTVRTRLIARPDQFRGVVDCVYQVVRKEGPLSLYRGLLPGIVSMAPAGAVFYGVYDLLKAHHLRSIRSDDKVDAKAAEQPSTFGTHRTELGTFRTLLYGGISGICAEATTYPLEVLRRQLQLQGARGMKLGLQETVQQILRQGGVGAFYAGLLPSSMQVIPSAALSYYVYEVCKNLLMVT